MAKRKNGRGRNRYTQFIEYMVSGGGYFWVGYLLLDYFYYILDWNLWWSTIISNIIGWSVNFVLQRYWAFNNPSLKGHQTQVTSRYIFITMVDFLLNYVILYGLRAVGITPAIGQFISSGFFTVWKFLWYRFWVFPDHLVKKRPKVTIARVFAHRVHGHRAFHPN